MVNVTLSLLELGGWIFKIISGFMHDSNLIRILEFWRLMFFMNLHWVN